MVFAWYFLRPKACKDLGSNKSIHPEGRIILQLKIHSRWMCKGQCDLLDILSARVEILYSCKNMMDYGFASAFAVMWNKGGLLGIQECGKLGSKVVF